MSLSRRTKTAQVKKANITYEHIDVMAMCCKSNISLLYLTHLLKLLSFSINHY